MNPFFGASGLFMWQGVVEDRHDPLKAGRVRVRVIGLHIDDVSEGGLPIESLKWAQVLQSGAAMNGIGDSLPKFVEGTWVMGISRDGRLCQDLVIIGSLAGAPDTSPKPFTGFGDHDNTYDVAKRPKRSDDASEHYPKKAYLNEADVNRLARNEQIDKTIVAKKRATLDKCALFSEPSTPYNAVYPFNAVDESESGHIVEVDDTPNAERMHTYHRSGTFEEVHPDGTKVIKVVGNSYEVRLGSNNIHVVGNCNVVIDGNSTVVVNKNANIHVKGSSTSTTDGGVTINAPSGTTHTGDINITGNVDVSGDVVASGISLVNHTHTGNLGFPTSAPN